MLVCDNFRRRIDAVTQPPPPPHNPHHLGVVVGHKESTKSFNQRNNNNINVNETYKTRMNMYYVHSASKTEHFISIET